MSTDGELGQILSFLRRTEEAVCDEVVPTAHGAAMVTPSLPLVWQLNALQVDDPEADWRELTEEAERIQGAYMHRKLVVHDEQLGRRLSAPLLQRGWNVFRLLVMTWSAEPEERDLPPAAEVEREAGAAALARFRREQPFGSQREAIEQLAGMDDRYGRALNARDFASPPDDPACALRLYTKDGIAQVDEVGTVEARRGQGHASAAVMAASARAREEGNETVFLLTDEADWPKTMYRRLGFEEIGVVHEFLRVPLGS
jgi:GNAT superfamily N-acetyltransferase